MPRASEHVYTTHVWTSGATDHVLIAAASLMSQSPFMRGQLSGFPQSFESCEIRVKRETAAGREMTTRECPLPPAPPRLCAVHVYRVYSRVQLSVSVRSSTQLYIGY